MKPVNIVIVVNKNIVWKHKWKHTCRKSGVGILQSVGQITAIYGEREEVGNKVSYRESHFPGDLAGRQSW